MRIETSFEVPADRSTAWALLLDVPRVVPCMPGATLVEEVDDSSWKANVSVKLGPIGLTFASDVTREEADEQACRVRLAVNARETRGRGAARASIESTLAQVDGRTEVGVVTDRNLSGSVAQYGRGIVQDVTEQLVAQFAACLQNQLAAEPGTEASAGTDPVAPPPPKPVSGGRLVLKALWGSIARLFRRG